MSTRTAPRHAEIAGGGIGGLTVATLLAHEGWTVTVHERNDTIREVGSGLVIHQSSAVVFEELGILDEITRGVTRFHTSSMWDEHGNVLVRKELDEAHRTFNPLRVPVIQAIYAAALKAGVEVRTDSQVVGARPEGVLVFADGSERRGDLVIGADGVNSAVRDSLPIKVDNRTLNSGCTRTVVPRGQFDSDDAFVELWSGSRRLGICPTSDALTYVYFACREDDLRGSKTPVDVDYWAKAFPVLPDEFLARLSQGEAIRHAYRYIKLSQWSAGRVAIIGDANHALPPTLGQGVGLAVGNARAMVHEVAHADDIPAALRGWEARVRPVIDTTQRWSMWYELASSRWPQRGAKLRSLVIKAVRSKRVQRSMSAADNQANAGWAA